MRVYELARILGVTSKDLMTELKRIRVSVKSASSSIEDKHVRKVMDRWEKRKAELEEEKKKKKEEEARRKRDEAERRKREAEERKKREAEERRQRAEEARRQREEEEKKREEEKRRKAEGQRQREEAEKRAAEEARKRPAPAPAPASGAAPPAVEAEAEESSGKPARGSRRRRRKRPRDSDEPVEIKELPKIEVMKLDDPRKLYAERARRRAKERKRRGREPETTEDKTAAADKNAPRKKGRRIRPSFVVPSARRESPQPQAPPAPAKPAEPKKVTLRGEVTVGQFAEKTDIPANEVIAKILSLGEMRTINQTLDGELMEILAEEFDIALEVIPETDEYDLREFAVADVAERMAVRPPVVTIMGHVDHGKTTLLDYIRKSRVVEGEYGGITQHIGAYRVATPRGEICFLDTPGHEAFTSMRARGAQVTDIVILVVAADDGVMPQTVEAIDHARAGQVPIIIAVNKIDKPEANLNRVRQELMQHNIVPEDLGGEHIVVPVSAKTGEGVDQMLEMVLLQAEVLELKADPNRRAEGVVVEARIDSTRGPVSTLLVQKGTLRVGDTLVIGREYGRVRAMVDEYGKHVEKAGPSHPVEVLGLGGSPEAGESFLVMPSEKEARNVAELRDDRRRERLLGSFGQRHVSLENLHEMVEEGKIKEFRLILKADVQGSIEAIAQALGRIQSEKIKVRILRAAVGPISESDVTLALASEAVIIGFNVRPDQQAAGAAEREGVQIMLYQVIYELIDDVRKAMTAELEPEKREVSLGRAEVREVFRISKVGNVAGCFVTDGEVRRGAQVRIVRDGVVIYDGLIGSVRRVKEDVERVQNGLECGINVANYQNVKEGDVLEVYMTEELPVEL